MDAIDLLRRLVQIPSPNPPGDTRAIADFVAEQMRAIGCQVRQLAPSAKPEALNTIATLGEGEPRVMLHAHIDTVPIATDEARNWHVDPYAAVVKDGALYGKGSIDDKASLAAMMLAMQQMAGRDLRGTLALVAAAEEEVGGQLGTKWLADAGHLPACDFIIVGEQTANRVATAHKGVLRATVRVRGKSVHATNPDRGINAIVAMGKIIAALQGYHRELSARSHPMAGSPTCNIGVIRGGSTANAVPDSCTIQLDRRMIPREDPAQVRAELDAVLDSVDIAPASASLDDFVYSSWFESRLETELGQLFLDCAHRELGAHPGPIGYLPGSDAKHLTDLALGDMVIFGPGSYEVAHAADEHVRLADYAATTAILGDFVARVLTPPEE
ncbi:MAG: M20 family metallopeptidase [Chloroflexi bacterium]|nr:M20 family metallopeptidase [Chloroflexota bacterium]